MEKWKKIWEKKGLLETNNLKLLDGFENTNIHEHSIAQSITKKINICAEDKVLEIGCGAGMIAQFLVCKYFGIDYSHSLVKKHKQILGNNVLVSEANKIPYPDKYFEKCFAFSVFHYFPDKDYSNQVINEMERVTKESIFIGDLPKCSHDSDHLLYNKTDFNKWEISPGFYNFNRFNLCKTINNDSNSA